MSRFKPPLPRIDRANPLSRGLVAAWPFHERGGTALRDIGPNRLSGTLENAPTRIESLVGPALSFNGTTQGVTLDAGAAGSPLDISGTGFSVAGWVKRNVSTTFAVLYSREQTATTQSKLYWRASSTSSPNQFTFGLRLSGSLVTWNSGTAYTGVDRWYHVAATYDGAFARIYVDGVLASQTAETRAIGSANLAAVLGRDNLTSVTYCAQQQADLRIWNRGLTAGEVRSLYSDPWALYDPDRHDLSIATIALAPVTLEPNAVTATAEVPAPTLDQTIEPPVPTATAQVPTPDFLVGDVITAGLPLATAEVPTPLLDFTLIPGIPTATATVPPPAFSEYAAEPFYSLQTPADLSTKVELDAEVSIVGTPGDPIGNPIDLVTLPPVATINGASASVAIAALSGGAKKFRITSPARAGKVADVVLTAYTQDGTSYVASWSFTYRPLFVPVTAPLGITVRGPADFSAPLLLSAKSGGAFTMPVQLTVPATGTLAARDMPLQLTVLDVVTGILAAKPMGVNYVAVDRMRERCARLGAVLSEWGEDRIHFGAVLEGTMRTTLALAATLTGPEREVVIRAAAEMSRWEREDVVRLGATLAEWGQDQVRLGADVQGVSRRVITEILVKTQNEQALDAE